MDGIRETGFPLLDEYEFLRHRRHDFRGTEFRGGENEEGPPDRASVRRPAGDILGGDRRGLSAVPGAAAFAFHDGCQCRFNRHGNDEPHRTDLFHIPGYRTSGFGLKRSRRCPDSDDPDLLRRLRAEDSVDFCRSASAVRHQYGGSVLPDYLDGDVAALYFLL